MPAGDIIAHNFRCAQPGGAGCFRGRRGACQRPCEALQIRLDFGRARSLANDVEVPTHAVELGEKRWRGNEYKADGGSERDRNDVEMSEREKRQRCSEARRGAQSDHGGAANASVQSAEPTKRIAVVGDLFTDLDVDEMRDDGWRGRL